MQAELLESGDSMPTSIYIWQDRLRPLLQGEWDPEAFRCALCMPGVLLLMPCLLRAGKCSCLRRRCMRCVRPGGRSSSLVLYAGLEAASWQCGVPYSCVVCLPTTYAPRHPPALPQYLLFGHLQKNVAEWSAAPACPRTTASSPSCNDTRPPFATFRQQRLDSYVEMCRGFAADVQAQRGWKGNFPTSSEDEEGSGGGAEQVAAGGSGGGTP